MRRRVAAVLAAVVLATSAHASQLAFLAPSRYLINYLVVAGGGGGGTNLTGFGIVYAGGGGAGGLARDDIWVTAGVSYTVTVGTGGAVNANGSNSSVPGICPSTMIGGGHGGQYNTNGVSGGSGGGGGGEVTTGGAGTGGQGNAGGNGVAGGTGGAAGGGAGSAASGNTPGSGFTSVLSGSSVEYAKGGYAGQAGTQPTTAGSGGNGGAGDSSSSNAGQNGVVILRYAGPQRATGGTVTSSGGFTIHTFTSNGTFKT